MKLWTRRNKPLPARLTVTLAVVVLTLTGSASADPQCYDRRTRPYTSVVDTHLHFRPFGGRAIPFSEVLEYLNKTGVRFVNAYGIGQTLPIDSPCTYYLDCPGTPVVPSIKNDFMNAANLLEHQKEGVHVTLSMTFPDLAHPESIMDQIRLLDKEYPQLFKWMGEVNLVKEALFNNGHRATPRETIQRWAPFMALLRDRDIPITIHSDLGNDAHPTKHIALMEEVLSLYPRNKIVWAHMGLSKELVAMDPASHIQIMADFLRRYPNLMFDISWRVLDDSYFGKPNIRDQYVQFFNDYPTRILPGSDFVARGTKNFDDYWNDLEVSSRINRYLDDEAFRHIALGQNYFRLLGLRRQAPPVCD